MRPPREFLLARGDRRDVSTWKDARRRHVASLARRVWERRRRTRRPRMGNACDAHVLDLLRNGRKTPAVEIHPTSPSERTPTRTAPGRETRSTCIPTHASTADWKGSRVQWLATTKKATGRCDGAFHRTAIGRACGVPSAILFWHRTGRLPELQMDG